MAFKVDTHTHPYMNVTVNLTSFKCKKAEGYDPRGKFSPCFSGSELATFLNLTREAVIVLSVYFNYQ